MCVCVRICWGLCLRCRRSQRGIQPRACNIDLTLRAIYGSLMAALEYHSCTLFPAASEIHKKIFIAFVFIYHHCKETAICVCTLHINLQYPQTVLYIIKSEVVKFQNIWIGRASWFGKDPSVHSRGLGLKPRYKNWLLISVINGTYENGREPG